MSTHICCLFFFALFVIFSLASGLNLSDAELTKLLNDLATRMAVREFSEKSLVPVLKEIGLKKPTRIAVDAHLKKLAANVHKSCTRCHDVVLHGQQHKFAGKHSMFVIVGQLHLALT
jgi:hypothetical protein